MLRTRRAEGVLALVAAGAAVAGAVMGSITSLFVAHRQIDSQSEQEARAGLRVERRAAYADASQAEARLWEDIYDAFYCLTLVTTGDRLEIASQSAELGPVTLRGDHEHDVKVRLQARRAIAGVIEEIDPSMRRFRRTLEPIMLIASDRSVTALRELIAQYSSIESRLVAEEAHLDDPGDWVPVSDAPPDLAATSEAVEAASTSREALVSGFRRDLGAGELGTSMRTTTYTVDCGLPAER